MIDEPSRTPEVGAEGPADPRTGAVALEGDPRRLPVELAVFRGPLDLLLHLVRVNQVDIYDIPIVEIARQYDQHLELMRQLDLNVAGEFLVMAATLAYIKSRMLLPQRPSEDGEEPEDPRQPLTEMLLEHQRFLLAAESLGARADVQERVWTRPEDDREDLQDEMTLEVSLFDLARVFRRLMEEVVARRGIELEPDGISVEERMGQLLDRLDAERMLPFTELFPREAPKRDLIVTFLAVLELLRLGMVRAWQSRRFGEIRVARGDRPAGAGTVGEV
jgi:segregation and condensation protein A